MYKDKTENIEVYFICYKKEEMELVETYYDEVLDTHCWYINGYLAYRYWKKDFKDLKIGELSKNLLIVATSRYILYLIENKKYKNKNELKELLNELAKIDKFLKKIIDENNYLLNL